MKIYPGIVICTEDAGMHLLDSFGFTGPVGCPGDQVKLRDSTPRLLIGGQNCRYNQF